MSKTTSAIIDWNEAHGNPTGIPTGCALKGNPPEEKERETKNKQTCQRTIIDKDWTGHSKRKCRKIATHQQDNGLPLCRYHYYKWFKKIKGE